MTPVEKNLSSGTSAIWSGTICNAKIAMKSQSRPLKLIQANAYAAIAANASREEHRRDGDRQSS